MRRCTVLLLALMTLYGGCVKTEIGSGKGQGVGLYSYANGELRAVYAIPMTSLWPKALEAIKALQLTIDHQEMDGLGGDIKVRRVNGKRIKVRLDPVNDKSTLVRVRVGPFGNKDNAERIHQTIYAQLGV